MPDHSGLSVSELNKLVSDAIRSDPRTRSLTVYGEVSGFRNQIASGHWYFSLKDEGSSVSCAMFRQNTPKAEFRPSDGDRITVTGYVDIYSRDGKYQLYVTSLRRAGIGEIYLRLEELKRRLSAEGLFDPGRKRPLPMLPRKVAVVTSQSGAALRDILNVSGKRSPGIPIVVVPATVQGSTGAPSVCEGIRRANEIPGVDVIIVARGGGSQEDLWCFNDESVARAVAASRIPVVSGVGHEIDFTLCDYAADVRASTPSNAAEIVFPDNSELRGRISFFRNALKKEECGYLDSRILKLLEMRKSLEVLSPGRRIENLIHEARMKRNVLENSMGNRLNSTETRIGAMRQTLNWQIDKRLADAGNRIDRLSAGLRAISPMSVLDRGFVMVRTSEGQFLKTAEEARKHEIMDLAFRDGTVRVRKEDNANE